MAKVGWGTFFGALGEIITKLPIQGRRERLKNELEKLEKERDTLLQEKCDDKKSKRYIIVINRLAELHSIIKNLAND